MPHFCGMIRSFIILHLSSFLIILHVSFPFLFPILLHFSSPPFSSLQIPILFYLVYYFFSIKRETKVLLVVKIFKGHLCHFFLAQSSLPSPSHCSPTQLPSPTGMYFWPLLPQETWAISLFYLMSDLFCGSKLCLQPPGRQVIQLLVAVLHILFRLLSLMSLF